MSRSPTSFAVAAVLVLASAGMSACVSDAALSGRSASVPVYAAKQIADAAGIQRVVGPVRGFVCNARYDAAKSQADALKQLQAQAVKRGGDGVARVQFTQITNTRSPCWHGVEATGLAVIYAR